MERKVRLSMLCEIHGKLLTKKQLSILTDYCDNDLSLSEIAENNNVTRQAVNDIIKKGESKLLEYESKLNIMKKTLEEEKLIQNILCELSKITDDSSDKQIARIINTVRKELISLNS